MSKLAEVWRKKQAQPGFHPDSATMASTFEVILHKDLPVGNFEQLLVVHQLSITNDSGSI